MFANKTQKTTRDIRSLRAWSLVAALLFSHAAAARADSPDVGWWIELVREREIPTALIEGRREAADEEARKAKEGEVGSGLRGTMKTLFRKWKKLQNPADTGEAPGGGGKPVARAGEAPAPDAVAPVDPEAEPLTLSVTVAMAGEVVGLDARSLMFRPVLQPSRVLKLPLKQIASLSRYAPGQAPPAEAPDDLEFRVVLRDGSEVPGQLVKLTEKAITVALVGSGAKIVLPLGEITRIERNVPIGTAAAGDLPEFPGRHIAVLSTGEVVAGQLLPSRDSDKWLRISSPILTAECPLSLIDLLVFPNPEAPAGAAEEALADAVEPENNGGNNGRPVADNAQAGASPPPEPGSQPEQQPESEPAVRHLVTLAPAGMIWAKSLRVEGDDLLVSALGQESFAVPLDRVESIAFEHESLSTNAQVLVWGGYCDKDDEYRKTVDALGDYIPTRKLIQSMAKVPDPEFMRHLRRARVLLIPEMEGLKRAQIMAAMGKEGRGCPSWKEAFHGFLRRGGNIIFLSPTGEALNFLNRSGLGPLRSGGSGAGWEFTADGKKLGVKVAGKIANVNSTHYYRKSEPWQIWGAASGGGDGAPLLGRRIERGWVMVFGADFYETNDDVTETLVRMIEFHGRR